MDKQLQIAELRTDTPQYAETIYRMQLMRFVNAYYSDIARDLLRGEGQYLTSLHRLMGSTGDNSCTKTYKDMMLLENNSPDFGFALWLLRAANKDSPTVGATTNTTGQQLQ
jgi:hypothetical protein